MRYGYVDAFGLCRQKQWSISEGQLPICVTVVVHTCGRILMSGGMCAAGVRCLCSVCWVRTCVVLRCLF